MLVANGGYAVQSFFGISGMLTTYLFMKSFEGKKNVKISHLVLAFINRYIRYAFMVRIRNENIKFYLQTDTSTFINGCHRRHVDGAC